MKSLGRLHMAKGGPVNALPGNACIIYYKCISNGQYGYGARRHFQRFDQSSSDDGREERPRGVVDQYLLCAANGRDMLQSRMDGPSAAAGSMYECGNRTRVQEVAHSLFLVRADNNEYRIDSLAHRQGIERMLQNGFASYGAQLLGDAAACTTALPCGDEQRHPI
jgi:hypothetical protein